jgi:hypothetical protein
MVKAIIEGPAHGSDLFMILRGILTKRGKVDVSAWPLIA